MVFDLYSLSEQIQLVQIVQVYIISLYAGVESFRTLFVDTFNGVACGHVMIILRWLTNMAPSYEWRAETKPRPRHSSRGTIYIVGKKTRE